MELQPGMILGEDVVNYGTLVYPADTKIDNMIIEKINRYPSIMCVTIKEDIDFASTHYEKIRLNDKFKQFEQAHAEALFQYKTMMYRFIQDGIKIPDDFFYGLYYKVTAFLPHSTALLDYLYNLVPNEDELTFTQSLNSALLAGTFADWISMNEEAKKTMILCGFYYDIGKLKLPYEILWKPGLLTEEEFAKVREHTLIGYDTLRGININPHVKNTALQHHERMDGSGYPFRFYGTNIDIYARYFAIIDSYTAMASPRSYRSAYTPLQILGIFEQSMEKFDVELLLPLMKRIADAQISSTVVLNDDTVWEVLVIHPNKFSRPILKNNHNQIIDLIEHPELEIIKNI
jgi:HD-GYP domain-containing protein (c-di-GMP phosphodiesterase class II)